ncbi:UNVERIFIED_CONTAM: Heavy metal-associated isoprenylated plant protein 28 [Sesamum latifolium]|uniref:Heavy metal-associated isoprenylated plant protein 28 n=1 Tax=Sesamum latifolium TaxID=2727402 RepID=A0AAW2WLI9_9LAMI
MQKVTVTGWADQNKVLKTVRKTGRKAELWPFPYNPEYHNFYTHYYRTLPDYFYSDDTNGYNSPANYIVADLPSRYNYHEHGYNGHEHGYYQQPPSLAILDDRATTMFSDDNATGCSVM